MLKGIIKILCGALCLFFASKLGPYTYGLYQQGQASEAWVPVEAQVEQFNIRSSNAKGSKYSRTSGKVENPHADIVYNYQYDGKNYSGERTGFGPYSKGQLIRPKKEVATVYVNPDKPSESVYIKGVSKPNLGAMAFSLGLALVGLILVMWGLKNIVRD